MLPAKCGSCSSAAAQPLPCHPQQLCSAQGFTCSVLERQAQSHHFSSDLREVSILMASTSGLRWGVQCYRLFSLLSAHLCKREKTKCSVPKNRNTFFFFFFPCCCRAVLWAPNSALDLPQQAEGACDLMAGYSRAMPTFASLGSISVVLSSG